MTKEKTERIDMRKTVYRGRHPGVLTALALYVFLACPAGAREGASPPPRARVPHPYP